MNIILVATHGEGEPTDNAKDFHKYCQQNIEENKKVMKGVNYCVFGLGKSSYEHYNAMGIYFASAFEQLGGKLIHKNGLGDDMGTLDDDFDLWKSTLYQNLNTAFSQIPNLSQPIIVKSKLVFEEYNQFSSSIQQQLDNLDIYEFQTKQLLSSKSVLVKSIKELRQSTEEGSTLHIVFDTNTQIEYETAMNLGVFIENSEEIIQELKNICQLDLNQQIIVRQEGQGRIIKLPFPSPITVKEILTKYVDVQGQLRKKQLKDLAECVNDQKKKEELLKIAESKEEFKQKIEEKMTTLLELIQQFNIKLSIKELVEIGTRINPRLYTISSSNKQHKGECHITASITEDSLKSGKIKVGLASQYFKNLQKQLNQGQTINVKIDFRQSNFTLPNDTSLPIIMVGPGAGIAPFRAFIWENHYLKNNQLNFFNNLTLYFGCRNQSKDFIYQDELTQLLNIKAFNDLYTAFSRDQPSKIYVQNLILQNKQQVYQHIQDQGIIYLCGNTQMGKDVSKILVDIIAEFQNISQEESQKQVSLLEENKKLIKELWG